MEKDEIIIQTIIDAAKKLMQQYGINKTTMEDIAKAAGKGKSTLYYYFKNKEEIFDLVGSQELSDFYETVKKAVDKEPDPVAKLKTYIVVKIKTLRGKANLYRSAIEDSPYGSLNGKFKMFQTKYDAEEINMIASILYLAIEKGKIRASEKKNVKDISELILSSVRGVEIDVITQNKFASLADKADLFVGILIKGLS
jgi:AcrR family transcriptional regulator